jgi:hypothetical protein
MFIDASPHSAAACEQFVTATNSQECCSYLTKKISKIQRKGAHGESYGSGVSNHDEIQAASKIVAV